MAQSTLDNKSNPNSKWNDNRNNNNNNNSSKNPKRQLVMKTGTKWYKLRLTSNLAKTQSSSSSNDEKLTREQITQFRSEALSLIKTDIFHYEEMKSSSSKRDDFEWIRTVLSNGTVSDKLAAHTVLIQDSTVHNLRSIETLLRFVNTKGKRECVMAIDNLRDLFVGDLLIPKEKLHTFEELVNHGIETGLLTVTTNDSNYTSTTDNSRAHFLIIAHVEDQIRSIYKRFLDQLVAVSHDNLEALKVKSLRTLFDLFINNPEQEKFILSCIINKLGDPIPKIASQTAHLLSQILSQHHPQMKMVIVKEVERLLFRPNITTRAQYYCLCFLCEIVFTATLDQEIANYLINIYFTIFNRYIKLGEVNNKTMSVLLTGVSRAFPYSKLETEFLEKYLDTFYRILHYVNLNTGIQTLSLIFNLVDFNESGSLTDRFYCVLFRFIFNSQIDQCNKANMLLNVIYRAIKRDPITKRIRAFVKQLFQISMVTSSSFVISVLILVSETIKVKKGFRIEPMVFDSNDSKKSSKSNSDPAGDEDDVEVYFDVDDDDKQTVTEKIDKEQLKSDEKESIPSWVYVQKNDKNFKDNDQDKPSKDNNYIINARNPLFSNADFEPLWELALVSRHYHPTAKLFADKLQSGESIEYDGDPLDDFTVKRFLDRFVFRNPKKMNSRNKKTDQSVKDTSRTTVFGKRRSKSAISNLSSADYLDQPEEAIPIDEQFIHRYLKQRKTLHTDMDDDESDVESVTSLEFNDVLDNYEKYTNDDAVDDIDFAKNYKENTKSKKKTKKSKQDSLDDDDDDEDEIDDEDVDFDEEFDIDDDDDDLMSDEMENENDGDQFDENEDEDGSDDDNEDDEDFNKLNFSSFDDDKKLSKNKARNAAPFAGKKGFSKITNDIFASAEEFSHLLEQNDESDSDFDLDDLDNTNGESSDQKQPGNKRKNMSKFGGKRKRPNLGRKGNKKKKRQGQMNNLDD